MSGEVVFAPVIVINPAVMTAVLAGGAVLAGFALTRLALEELKKQRQQLREQAEREAKQRQRELTVWQDWQQLQQQNLEMNASQREQVQAALDKLQLVFSESTRSENTQVRAQSFVQNVQAIKIQEAFDKAEAFMQSLPEALKIAENAPFSRLQKQLQNWQIQLAEKQSISLEMLEDFQRMIEATSQQLINKLNKEKLLKEKNIKLAEQMLGEIFSYSEQLKYLADKQLSKTFDNLSRKLIELLENGTLSSDSLEILNKQFTNLQQQSEDALAQLALQRSLQTRVQHHLTQMGYQSISENPETGHNVWHIPGGEQLQARIHADGRMAFQVMHERSHQRNESLNDAEFEFLQQQEKRWCGDAKQLLRQLVQDGFEYKYQFERDLPGENVPIVVVETADDWAEDEARERLHHSRAQTRYLKD